MYFLPNFSSLILFLLIIFAFSFLDVPDVPWDCSLVVGGHDQLLSSFSHWILVEEEVMAELSTLHLMILSSTDNQIIELLLLLVEHCVPPVPPLLPSHAVHEEARQQAVHVRPVQEQIVPKNMRTKLMLWPVNGPGVTACWLD